MNREELEEQGHKNRQEGFEVVGQDTDGALLCKDNITGKIYNSGDTLKDFGEHNLSVREKETLGIL